MALDPVNAFAFFLSFFFFSFFFGKSAKGYTSFFLLREPDPNKKC